MDNGGVDYPSVSFADTSPDKERLCGRIVMRLY